MTIRQRFLIVSNARTGSTWLETLLGALPDVAVDYEFKWRPDYQPHGVHLVIPDENFSCRAGIDSISVSAPVVGSKLVLDPRSHGQKELLSLERTIEPVLNIYERLADPLGPDEIYM